jgi:hypothetical protein
VRPNQIYLQLANLITGNADVTQLSDAGGYGIREFVAGYDLIDDGASAIDHLAGIGQKQDGAAFHSNFADCFECEIVSVNVKCVQRSS